MELRYLFAFVLSLGLTLLIMPRLIVRLRALKFGQSISEYSLDQYKEKQGTPNMGGVAFVLVPLVVFNVLFFKEWSLTSFLLNFTYLGYALIGFWDDMKIIKEGKNDGLSARFKFFLQTVLAIIFYFFYQQIASTSITLFSSSITLELGIIYAFLTLFMLTGVSNAVNITDGMDGLAGGTVLLALFPFTIFAIVAKEVVVAGFLLSVLGSLLGYLKYNVFPAKIIMGDTGSLPLGALLATAAILLKHELLLIIIGGVFVYETMCVILQIGSVKLRKKRIFKYTPIHYSFVISGWREIRVVQFFWMLGFLFAVIGFLLGMV